MVKRDYGAALRESIRENGILPFIGVYDVFSASIAGQHFDNIFLGGLSVTASKYGLPDIGMITWTDMLDLVQRVRAVLPNHHIIVDIDDGYADQVVAGHAVKCLEQAGASAVVLEDQKRPRQCGHLDGKQVLSSDEYVEKLKHVIDACNSMLVIARTDVAEHEAVERLTRYAKAGADMVLADGIVNKNLYSELGKVVSVPLVCNQLFGGKTAPITLDEMQALGVSVALYSTPCLASAQSAIDSSMRALKSSAGLSDARTNGNVDLSQINTLLDFNLKAGTKE